MRLLPFLAVSTGLVVTPGPDMALLTKNALVHGRRAALATAIGVNLGIAIWSVAAAAGLAALLRTSAAAFAVLRLAGATYLVWLGVRALARAARPGADVREELRRGVDKHLALEARQAFRQGLISNLLNPKIVVFFTSLLPQFVPVHGTHVADLLLLGGLFNAMGVVWLSAYAITAARARVVLQRPAIRRVIDGASGLVLIGLGARLALDRGR